MMQRLIAWQDTVFRGTDLAPLQAEIIEQLIVKRAKMLMMTMETRTPAMPTAQTHWSQPMQEIRKACFHCMP